MAKTNRGIENPFIVRVGVKDKNGKWRKVSISPALYTALDVVGRKQSVPVSAKYILERFAEKLTDNDLEKSSLSRALQDEAVFFLVEALGGKELRDEVVSQRDSFIDDETE